MRYGRLLSSLTLCVCFRVCCVLQALSHWQALLQHDLPCVLPWPADNCSRHAPLQACPGEHGMCASWGGGGGGSRSFFAILCMPLFIPVMVSAQCNGPKHLVWEATSLRVGLVKSALPHLKHFELADSTSDFTQALQCVCVCVCVCCDCVWAPWCICERASVTTCTYIVFAVCSFSYLLCRSFRFLSSVLSAGTSLPGPCMSWLPVVDLSCHGWPEGHAEVSVKAPLAELRLIVGDGQKSLPSVL